MLAGEDASSVDLLRIGLTTGFVLFVVVGASLGARALDQRVALAVAPAAEDPEVDSAAVPDTASSNPVPGALAMALALSGWSVLPMSDNLFVADTGFSLLFVAGLVVLSVLVVPLSAWWSGGRRAFHAALRSMALTAPFVLALACVLFAVALSARSLSARQLVAAQQTGLADAFGLPWLTMLNWNIWPFLPFFAVFMVSSWIVLQSLKADSVGRPAGLFCHARMRASAAAGDNAVIAAYALAVLLCGVATIVFFGGWSPPIDTPLLQMVPGPVWFFAKLGGLLAALMMMCAVITPERRATLWRMGWRRVLPASAAAFIVAAAVARFFV
ncbi:MAG: NADH-quinone oxidoreductase subunit H [Pseudomonadota bacterium]